MSSIPTRARCAICAGGIDDAADHVGLGRLTDDRASPLFERNHAQFHRTCLAVWPGLSTLIESLETIDGDHLAPAIMDLVTLRARKA